jgi:putative membrane protein
MARRSITAPWLGSFTMAAVTTVAVAISPGVAFGQIQPVPTQPSTPTSPPGSPRATPQPDLPSPGKGATSDSAFVMEVTAGGMKEVALGKMASDKAMNARVKEFAARMVTDHSKANSELQTLAGRKGWSVSKETPKASDEQHLHAANGAAFDRAYMDTMVDAHAKTISRFEAYISSAGDSELKAWAQETLSTVREHHKLATEIRKSLPST